MHMGATIQSSTLRRGNAKKEDKVIANNYQQFSVQAEGTKEEMDALQALLDLDASKSEDSDYDNTYSISGWQRDSENTIWFNSEEYENVDALATVISAWQIQENITKPFSVSWADTCSKPRLDEFGGGAFVVYKGEQHWISTYEWVDQKIKELSL